MKTMRTGPFDDPLGGWPNDDLLLTAKGRESLATAHPEAFRVLDWPELRAAFRAHDHAATKAKRWNRAQGISGLSISGLGVMVLAITPLLPEAHSNSAAVAALIFMSLGGIMGLVHWTVLRSKRTWLGHRFWTERLRQLHFQSLASNLDLVSLAMADDAALETLKRKRVTWLADLSHEAADPRHLIRDVTDDFTDRQAWLQSDFAQDNVPKAPMTQLAPLFTALERLRIGVQYEYAQRNLGSDIYSAPFRAKALRFVADTAFLLTLAVTVTAWVSVVLKPDLLHLTLPEWTGLAGFVSAAGLTCKSLMEGMQVEADTERYITYAEALREVKAQFQQASPKAKVTALRRLELIAYREMRHFLRTHDAARFLG